MISVSIRLGILSALNLGISFAFQWFILTELGPGVATDALFAGMALPQLVLTVITGSLAHVLVPLLAGENAALQRQDAWAFLILIAALFGGLSSLLYVSAPWWIAVVVPGFNPDGVALTIALTRIQLVGMVFTAINGVQWAAYHARQRFVWAEASQILAGVFGLVMLWIFLPRYGVLAAAWIASFRIVFQTLLLAPGMGWPVWPGLHRPAVGEAWRRIKPLLLGTTYYKTDPLVDRFLLSSAASGSLSLYYLAQQLYGAAIQILNKAIATPMVPLLSRLHKGGDLEGFRRVWLTRLVGSCALVLLCLICLCLLGESVLGWLIGHGSITTENVLGLWWTMLWLSGLFLGSVAGQITSSAFYARGDTITPTRLSMISYTIYVPCKILSYFSFGVQGLALVTSAYYLANVCLQIKYLRTRV